MSLDPKDPDVAATYSIDIWRELVPEFRRHQQYAVGAVIRPQRDTGFYYRCTRGGRTGGEYPTWPRKEDEAVADTKRGSADWVTVHPDDADLPTIDSVVWTLPAALTLDSQQQTDHVADVTVSGGDAGTEYQATARITPTVGNPFDLTITIPVEDL